IYYASNEPGDWSIWKVPAGGGPRVHVTSEIGFEPRQSPDGRSIYFIDRPRFYGLGPVATVRRGSVDGGPAEAVNAPIRPGAWEVTEAGIVFIAGRSSPVDVPDGHDVLQIYDFAARRVRTLGELTFRVSTFGVNHFLAVSPDGRWAVATHT